MALMVGAAAWNYIHLGNSRNKAMRAAGRGRAAGRRREGSLTMMKRMRGTTMMLMVGPGVT